MAGHRHSRWAGVALSLWLLAGFAPPAAAWHETLSPEETEAVQRGESLFQQAQAAAQAGQMEEAAALYQDVLALWRQQLGNQHLYVAFTLGYLAQIDVARGNFEAAVAANQEALAIYRAQPLDDTTRLYVATGLNQLATVYINQGQATGSPADQAEPLLLEAVEIYRQQLGERHVEVAVMMSNLSALYNYQGRFQEAEALALQALDIYRENYDDSHLNVLSSLSNLAQIYHNQGRYSESEAAFLEVLPQLREHLGDNHPLTITAIDNLALLYQDIGRYPEALPLRQETLAIQQALYGDSDWRLVDSLNSLAAIHESLGRYSQAETLYRRALGIHEAAFGSGNPFQAVIQQNLAQLYQNQGRYDEAEPLLLAALAATRNGSGRTSEYVATILSNLGLLYSEQGRHEEAERVTLEAIATATAAYGEGHLTVARIWLNLGRLYDRYGRHHQSAAAYEQGVAILRQQDYEHPTVAVGLDGLAWTYYLQGRYDEAEALYQEAQAIIRSRLGPNHRDLASSLMNLGWLYHRQERYGESEKMHLEALRINQEQLGERHPNTALAMGNVAWLYRIQGKTDQAMATLSKSLQVEESNLQLNLAVLSDAARQDYAATLTNSLSSALMLHLESLPTDAQAAELALQTLLQRKGRVLDAGSESLQTLRQNLAPPEQRLLDDLQAVRQQLASLIFTPAGENGDAGSPTPGQIASLEAQANQLEADLARRSSLFQAESQSIDVAAVRSRLPEDAVLVEYVRYEAFSAETTHTGLPEPRYAVYLLFADGTIRAVELGEAAPIEAAIQTLATRLEDPNQPVRAVHEAAQALDQRVMAPIRAELGGVEQLLISPDGGLNQIPFEVLRSAEDRYLVEDFAVSYLNSGRDLLKLDVIPASERAAVIMAAPKYSQAATVASADTGQRSVDLQSLTVAPLEFAAREGQILSRLLPGAVFYSGAEATETALKQVDSPGLLHIATHGLFLADAPRRTVTGSQQPVVYSVSMENPLLRSMLALAGFNDRNGGADDGVLTALEAASLDLYGTQLVALSACETGQGEIVNGEGVYGLRRAFTLAGAESILMSLWRVDDAGTAGLMERYYENLLGGLGRGEALRQIQLEMLDSEGPERHPYYWAAFVLAGDWRSLEVQ